MLVSREGGQSLENLSDGTYVIPLSGYHANALGATRAAKSISIHQSKLSGLTTYKLLRPVRE